MKIYVTGCKTRNGYKMHAPKFPYLSTVYIGYTRTQMQKQYRKDHGLKYKRIEWIIVE